MSKEDKKAFIFTLKNPHGVEPTRFMKRKDSREAIYCDFCWGPYFLDIAMESGGVSLNEEMKSDYYIHNNGKGSYECHPEYKSSLYVNTGGPEETNFFHYWILKCLLLIMKTEKISTNYVNILISYGNILTLKIYQKSL